MKQIYDSRNSLAVSIHRSCYALSRFFDSTHIHTRKIKVFSFCLQRISMYRSSTNVMCMWNLKKMLKECNVCDKVGKSHQLTILLFNKFLPNVFFPVFRFPFLFLQIRFMNNFQLWFKSNHLSYSISRFFCSLHVQCFFFCWFLRTDDLFHIGIASFLLQQHKIKSQNIWNNKKSLFCSFIRFWRV